MKSIKYFSYIVAFIIATGCEQEVITLQDPCVVDPDSCEPNTECADAVAGNANFTKFVAIGNSFVAGVQAGALFTDAQNNSLPLIINKQLECGDASATFKQPTIGASLGWNLFITQPFLTDNTKPILGRLLLQYGGATSPKPTPQAYPPGVLEALPNPTFNPGFMYTGSKTELNNFAVPAITLGQALTPATGNWAVPNPALGFSPFYARFASIPGTSSIITDANAAQGTFAMVWLGLDDFFLYAAFGADPAKAPLTDPATFAAQYGAVFGHPAFGMFTVNPTIKGVVANFPDIFVMPHFTSVTYNAIPLAAANAEALNTGFAGYNAAVEGLKNPAFGGAFGTSAELDARKVSFIAGNNKILLEDESILDLGSGFDALLGVGAITAGQRAQLVPYEQVRQSTPTDVFPLSTGSILGTPGTFGVRGLSEAIIDQYAIIPTEKNAINAARTAYNATVKAVADAYPTRLAHADVNAALTTLVTNKAGVYNGVTITPNINPPTGIYSEDGVHPNKRGYAFLSRVFIEAINTKFGSTIPLTDISKYQATALPIP